MTTSAHAKEDRVLASLIGCANDLCGLDLVIEGHPDRNMPGCEAIEHGCDAVLASSRISNKIAVQIGEVPVSVSAYAKNARLGLLREYLLPRMLAAFCGRVIDVVVHSETLPKFFDYKKLGNLIFDFVESVPDGVGLDRYRYSSVFLGGGVRIDVLKKFSSFPCVSICCGLSSGDGFDISFKRVLKKKCDQFVLYKRSHLSCVVLWSSDICYVSESLVVDAFRLSGVDPSCVNSIWFVHATGFPMVFPLYSNIHDCRASDYSVEPYYWWPGADRPFKIIPHPFGCSPVGE